VRILIRVLSSRLLPAFIGSDLLTTTERSAISQPIGLAFPFRGYTDPTLYAFTSRKLRDFPRSSAHSLPSILTLIPSMSLVGHVPLFVFLQDMLIRIGFPFFGRVEHRRTSGSPHSGLDFACRPFGFPLARDTLPVLLPFEVRTSASATAL
jgi:hypothetical protein